MNPHSRKVVGCEGAASHPCNWMGFNRAGWNSLIQVMVKISCPLHPSKIAKMFYFTSFFHLNVNPPVINPFLVVNVELFFLTLEIKER